MTEVIITMAGFGRRFLDAGYTVPKYQITAHGKSLFAWSMLSLREFIQQGAHFVFVVRKADGSSSFIKTEAKKVGIQSVSIVELESSTDGQATTAALAAKQIRNRQDGMLIYNIDTFVHPDVLPVDSVRGTGWIPCFDAVGDAWSFAAADQSGRVSEVREKNRISRHATIGLYWFDSFDIFEQIYDRHYSIPANLEKGERYVAPIYNTLIASGGDVFIHSVPVDSVIPLGTPADVERFLSSTTPLL